MYNVAYPIIEFSQSFPSYENWYWEEAAIVKKALPIGIDNFEKMISQGYYYIDKTLFIKELLDLNGRWGCKKNGGYIKWAAFPYHQLL